MAGLRRKRGFQFLAGIVVIFAFSSLPQSTLTSWNPGLASAWGHLLEFGLLGWLWARWQQVAGGSGLTSWVGGLGLVLLIAVADEAYQAVVPGRQSDVLDVMVDLLGFGAGALVTWCYLRRRSVAGVRVDPTEGKS